MSSKNKSLNFIDIFAGAGGLSCGLEMASHRCLLGIDYDKHAMDTFALNHPKAEVYCGEIQKLTTKELLRLTKGEKIHLVVGGPPCQGFSTVGRGDPKDKRNRLFLEYCRIVRDLKPDFIVMENVTGILAQKNRAVLKGIFKTFNEMGYHLDVQVMEAHLYGVPERRRRTIFLGTRLNTPIVFPKTQSTLATVGDVMKTIQKSKKSLQNHDILKAGISLAIDKERIALIPEGKGIRYEEDELKYFPKSLSLNIDWKNLKENRLRQTKYQRLHRKMVSNTIMTHRYNYFHPTENRYLTVREAATIQSFPLDFVFSGPLTAQWRQVGNAVPPLLAKAIGEVICEMSGLAQKVKDKNLGDKLLGMQKERLKTITGNAFTYRLPSP